ncbi:MAG: hypothetical protein WC736_00595 [Gallionella sp.]|jgi:hypothetical protein
MKTPKQIAEDYGALFMPVGLNEKCGVALHTLALRPLNALRHPPNECASGWYIWGGEHFSEAPDFFKPLHVLHLADYCSEIIPYLALGSGWRVLLAPNYEDVWFDEKLILV